MGSGGIDEYNPAGALTTFYSVANAVPQGVVYDSESHKLYMSYGSTSGNGGGISAFSSNANGTWNATPANFQTFATGTLFTIAYESPEPSTVLLFAGGLLSVGLIRRRRVSA